MNTSKRTLVVLFFVGLLIFAGMGMYLAPMFQGSIYETIQMWDNTRPFQIVPQTPKVMLAFCGIYAAVFLMAFTGRKPTRAGEEHGSARWQNPTDVCRRVCSPDFFNNRILSMHVRIAIVGKSVLKSLNTFLVGGMGQGKSYFFMIPNILQCIGSMVITDPSGELVGRTGVFLEQKGYKVKVVDTESIVSSLRYNFFRYLTSEEEILEIVDIIFDATAGGENKGNMDPMWELLAKDRLTAYIALLWQRGLPEEKNMDTVLWLFEHDISEGDKDGNRKENAVSALFADEAIRNPGNIATSKYLSSTKGAVETVMGIESTLSGRLGRFMIPSVREMMKTDELELEKIGQEKTALFLVIPSESKSFNFIISMIYAQIFRTLFAQGRKASDKKLKVPVQFFLDEMANIVLPKDFPTYLTTGRKHGISFVCSLQDLAQAEKLFPGKVHETVIGTNSSFLYLGGSGKYTDEYISKWVGQQTITTSSQSVSYGVHGHSSRSFQQQGRDLIRADELDSMPSSKCLVRIQGYGWMMDEKYRPAAHPRYKECADVTGEYYDWRMQEERPSICRLDADAVQTEITIDANQISATALAAKYNLFWDD